MNVYELIGKLCALPEEKKAWPVLCPDDMFESEVSDVCEGTDGDWDNKFENIIGRHGVIRLS